MVIKKPLVNLQQTWPKFIVALHVVGPSCLPFLCMEFEDGASGLAKWVLIPPFSDARLEGVLQFQRDYTLCQDAGEGNASNSGGSESSSSWLLKTGVFFILSDILWGA